MSASRAGARISVVIPCRDGAAFLAEALTSVQAQTRPADEVIVVDDRSTDDSVAIARRHGATVLHTEAPGGTAVARNLGWRSASGELIAFLDADDRWRPRHLELVAPLFERAPEAVLAFGSIEMFGELTGRYDGHAPATGEPVDCSLLAAAVCPAPQMTCIVPRLELEATGGFDESLKAVEDFELMARLSRRGPFIGIHEVTADYRQHAAQTTRARARVVGVECTQVRAQSMEQMRSRLSAVEFAQLQHRVSALWGETMHDAWWSADSQALDALLGLSEHAAVAPAVARRWRLRRRFLWPVWRPILFHGRRLKHSRRFPSGLDSVWRRLRGLPQ